MKQLIKDIEKLLKSSSEEDKIYANQLLEWLKEWLTPHDAEALDDSDHPPPPPPHK